MAARLEQGSISIVGGPPGHGFNFVLPCGYFHLVFTLPHLLNPLVLHNRRLCLDLIFKTVNQTLQLFAADPKWRLNGQLGFIGVLHTWSQTLIDHFHLHCLIPAGVLTRGDQRWVRTRKKFLFRRESLAACFRNRYLAQLRALYNKGKLVLPAEWNDAKFQAILAACDPRDVACDPRDVV
jgi:hypothetical protein